jgi:phage terminase large subunit GpA-like protein
MMTMATKRVLSRTEAVEQSAKVKQTFSDIIPRRVPRMSMPEWAEQNRVLPQGVTPYPGPFRWEVVPYLREIADCLSETSQVRKVALMKGAQIAATVGLGENWLGYIIDVVPGPTLYISGDAGMAKDSAGRRIDAMIRHAGLGDRIFAQGKSKSSRKSGDTATEKEFPGGFIRAIGPRSGSKLRSDSIKYLYADEVDAYPESTGKEGDPIALAERRTDAYEASRKILYTSTPLIEQTSKIKQLHDNRRKYYVPCKHCGHMQPLIWGEKEKLGGIKFDTDEYGRLVWDSVAYQCEQCGGYWHNADKAWFLPRGEWRPTAEAAEPGFRSYHISSLYSPVGFRSWESGVQEFLENKDDPVQYQTFVNTFLGEPWVDYGEKPRLEAIVTRERPYRVNEKPESAKPLLVTIGCDVQQDRIECEIVAWGRNAESWSVDYRVFYGDTADPDDPCWEELRATVHEEHFGLYATLTGIDAGYRTDVVYQFADSFDEGVHPVMGYDNLGSQATYTKLRHVTEAATPRLDMNVDLLKQRVYSYLNKQQYEDGRKPIGYCNFPVDYDREHFNRLTAESRVLSSTGKFVWDAGGRRNEQLDCRVYALGLLHAFKQSVEEGYGLEPGQLPWNDFWDWLES